MTRILHAFVLAALLGAAAGCGGGSSGTTALSTPSAHPTASASTGPPLSPYPCKVPGYSKVLFVHAVRGTPPDATLVVQRVQPTCGVVDDVQYVAVGKTYTVALAPNARIRLDSGFKLRHVSLRELADYLIAGPKDRDKQFNYFTSDFGARTNAAGQITVLDVLYHP